VSVACDELSALGAAGMMLQSPFARGITGRGESERCLCEDGLTMDV